MKIRIEPYKTWSGGAKRLGQHAGILRATKKQVRKHGDFTHIINWGKSKRRFNGTYINQPEAVATASSKLESAEAFKAAGVDQPDFTTEKLVAQGWLDDGISVVARRLLRANGGRGIVLVDPGDELPNAPLFTKYVKKSQEFRIHVFDGQIIDRQEKKRSLEVEDEKVNWRIRNVAGGFIFARDDIVVPACVDSCALAAVDALMLDFGAVDIGYNKHYNKAVVYEVNTAPGLEGSTLDAYYEALRKKLPAIRGGMYARRRRVA